MAVDGRFWRGPPSALAPRDPVGNEFFRQMADGAKVTIHYVPADHVSYRQPIRGLAHNVRIPSRSGVPVRASQPVAHASKVLT